MERVNFAVCDDDEIVCDAVCSRVYNIFKRCGIEARGTKYLSSVKLYNSIVHPPEDMPIRIRTRGHPAEQVCNAIGNLVRGVVTESRVQQQRWLMSPVKFFAVLLSPTEFSHRIAHRNTTATSTVMRLIVGLPEEAECRSGRIGI